jgi:nitroreductase
MPLIDLFKQRRSVRDFLDKPVEREKIIACLEAARLAPSASNSQPWSFLIVNEPGLRDKLCKETFGGLYLFNDFCRKAPVILVVISEQSKFLTRIGALFRGTQFYLIDIGIAVEHFILQAEELGLGTCWIGWFNEKAVKKTLTIPESKKVDILVAVGYRDTTKPFNEYKREKLEDIVAFNRYKPR